MIDPTHPLRGLPLAVLDVETTGLDAGTDAIVSVAVVHATLGSDEPPRLAYSTLIRPWRSIPEAVTAIHGITDADVTDAPTWAQAWPEIAATVEGRVLCAHNAPFDAGFVGAECARIGASVPGGKLWLCTQVAAYVVDRYQSSKRLVDVAARRGIVLDAHGAAGDALTAALLAPGLWREALRITGSTGAAAPETYRALLSWQHAEALRQERDFVAYLIRQGARGERPSSPWHALLEVPAPEWPERPAVRPTHRITRDGTVVPVEAP